MSQPTLMVGNMTTIADIRSVVQDLPRSYEVVISDRVKFRVGQIVYLSFSKDEALMGFAFPKEERSALVNTYPETFILPGPVDMRFNWVVARLAALDPDEASDYVLEAWAMVVPHKVSREWFGEPSDE